MALHQQISFFVLIISASCISAEDCKNVKLTANRGEFTSPNYPNEYPHNANCTWTIVAPEGHRVRLSFEEFDVENPFWDCRHDYVTVAIDDTTTAKYCNDEGNKPPAKIESKSNKLVVKLTSDAFFVNGVGFKAVYDIITDDGVPLEGETEEEDNDNSWDDWDETDAVTESTTTTTTPKPTTTTVATTTRATTTSEASTTTAAAPSTTSTLLKKITDSIQNPGDDNDSNGISNNPGAMSGAVLGSIIGAVLIIFGIILIVAFCHWKRNKNKRIDLSAVETHDGKTLIKQKKYKKQNNRIVRIPEAETFPL